jgi:SRSO17 transposase
MSLDPLAEYLGLFRGAFRRRDQERWAGVYLRGLLRDLPRKTVEGLARHARLPPGVEVESLTQALHNFLNQSPWDEAQLWRRLRALVAARLGRPEGVFVLDEVAIPKQGAHSVGVQRQFSHALGGKLNCQLAVAVYYVSPAGCCPVALRLYLPGCWLASAERLDAAGVPPAGRRRLNKAQLALQLLDEACAAGLPGGRVVASLGPGALSALLEGLGQRGLSGALEAGPDVAVVREAGGRPERLADLARAVRWDDDYAWVPLHSYPGRAGAAGGRLWALLERQPVGTVGFALADLSGGADAAEATRLWQALAAARRGREEFRDLGLDHFEGRSWRGFHHHACLVALACGFRKAGGEGPG